eukprot:gene9071-biopygen3392
MMHNVRVRVGCTTCVGYSPPRCCSSTRRIDTNSVPVSHHLTATSKQDKLQRAMAQNLCTQIPSSACTRTASGRSARTSSVQSICSGGARPGAAPAPARRKQSADNVIIRV